MQAFFHRFSLNSRQSKLEKFSNLKGFSPKTRIFLLNSREIPNFPIKMKGFSTKLKDFSPKFKVSEILLLLKPQNRWKKPDLMSWLYLIYVI